jgi:hypothetical protein
MRTIDSSISVQHDFGANERDTDDVIRLVAETPMWLMGITFFVSAIHILFDVLALRSDVMFWSSSKSLRGLSRRALAIDLVGQFVVAVYLQSEGSSLLVLVPQYAGAGLALWKVLRASGLVFELRWRVVPIVRYDSKLAATANEQSTAQFDSEALAYLSILLSPLFVGFALFELLICEHASWASFALTTAVSAVYGAGFALMTPQLYINHRLRSVAHLPWAVLGYRFFNTIIDDLFSFIVKMPTMARVAVFRDDVVFLVYLGQRLAFPVDRARPAEGFDSEGDLEGNS